MSELKRLSEVEASKEPERYSTGISGLDACLAEAEDAPQGVPAGVSILLSGMPGGGKSTIATYMAAAKTGRESLIAHGEERAERVRRRWDRLGIDIKEIDPFLLPLKSGEECLETIRDISAGERGLGVTVIDSIQTISWDNKRKYDAQYEAVEAIAGQVCSADGVAVFVSHVSKTGNDHAGAAALAHLVDIHIHVTSNAKRNERLLEVRKNRMGRAGFQVPINVTATGLSVGVPAPLNPANGGVMARTALEKACETAYTILLTGDRLDGYDFDKANVGGGMWRAGLEMATKRLVRDGFKVLEEKVKGRKGFRLSMDPATGMPEFETGSEAEKLMLSKIVVVDKAQDGNPLPIELT
jgi:KaiC/GvpD/RAD55 family RecA-like ATPase